MPLMMIQKMWLINGFLVLPLGNLHQSQYCDRIKVLVEFLGTKLSLDELTTIWKMQVHCITEQN